MASIQNHSSSFLNHLMQASTQALYECQESMKNKEGGILKASQGLNTNQTHGLLRLMETLVDTKTQLSNEIAANRIRFIDPQILNAMEIAIETVIANPLDSRVNQIYFSIFGYNSPLWQLLKEMQKLLQTVEVLKDSRGKKVAKVEKKIPERRKKRHEKGLSYHDEEE